MSDKQLIQTRITTAIANRYGMQWRPHAWLIFQEVIAGKVIKNPFGKRKKVPTCDRVAYAVYEQYRILTTNYT
jgi:hypothetical protein